LAAPRVWDTIRHGHFGPVLPYHTTNSYMVGLLGVQDGSERLSKIFEALPRGQPVAVVVPDRNEKAIFLGYLVSYFAWPREAHSISVTRANAAEQLRSLKESPPAAIFFCGITPPPDLQPAFRIGTNLVMAQPSANAVAGR
jgi:hypothetical protein